MYKITFFRRQKNQEPSCLLRQSVSLVEHRDLNHKMIQSILRRLSDFLEVLRVTIESVSRRRLIYKEFRIVLSRTLRIRTGFHSNDDGDPLLYLGKKNQKVQRSLKEKNLLRLSLCITFPPIPLTSKSERRHDIIYYIGLSNFFICSQYYMLYACQILLMRTPNFRLNLLFFINVNY